MSIEIKVPVLGESVVEATVAKWMKNVGEKVNADEPIVELETDKVSLEVPSPKAGVLTDIVAQEGDTVEVDAILALLQKSGRGRIDKKWISKKGDLTCSFLVSFQTSVKKLGQINLWFINKVFIIFC